MIFTIRLAKKNIEIHSLYEKVYSYCENFIVNNIDNPDVIITISEDDIDSERRILAEEEKRPGGRSTTTNYTSRVLEIYVLHRKVADALITYNTIVFHGVAICLKNENSTFDDAYIFTGKSGIGKTTHANLWIQNVPNAYILNGDKPLLKIEKDEVYVYGSPWQGKERIGVNGCARLKAICFIQRAEENNLKKVDFFDYYVELLKQTHRPKDKDLMNKTLNLLENLNCFFYKLECNNFKNNAIEVSTCIIC